MRFLPFIILLLFACHKRKYPGDEIIIHSEPEIQTIDTSIFHFNCARAEEELYKSKLKPKLNRLKELTHQYQIIKIGKVKKKTSIVYRAVEQKPELCFSSQNCYKIASLTNLKASIHSINYALVKGKKDLGENRFAKADIEEVIFNTEECAKNFISYINHVRNIEYMWDSLDKAPSSMFRENNKIYFIRMRGIYMKRFNLSIKRKMKN